MELMAELVNNQLTLYIPVALVLVAAILVFAFGFKSAEQPPFDKLAAVANDDRKSFAKKRKIKDKKSANGVAVPVTDSKNEKASQKDKESKRSPTKEAPDTKQIKKQDNNSPKPAEKKKPEPQRPKKIETVEEIKNRKNLKNKQNEKPLDYDDGNWETVPSKNDKKKKQDSPAKKEKKPKKLADNKEIEKLIKDEVNKQLQEELLSSSGNLSLKLSLDNKTTENLKKNVPVKTAKEEVAAIIPVVEEKKLKKEKKPKKEKEEVEIIKAAPEKPAKVTVEEVKEVPKAVAKESPVKKQTTATPAFDELGDIWTEAKAAKKSKKKSRRDN